MSLCIRFDVILSFFVSFRILSFHHDRTLTRTYRTAERRYEGWAWTGVRNRHRHHYRTPFAVSTRNGPTRWSMTFAFVTMILFFSYQPRVYGR